ncbi:alpha/beta hydrolase [Aliikangiella coralliicola]|uniref:Alpha/beta hydrolase n=1 Tax=Aliikangiella coralliicola TaxID=2592383 RepID=A0A545UIL8_9GAMM|nr:alpha/beta hydrolase [Aliikangiella coralliicola]TQV89309.1 alpha/beta hydrolase [Aliikangiella coralliicola]
MLISKKFFLIIAATIVGLALTTLTIGHYLTLPNPLKVGKPPASLEASEVNIQGVSGWFSESDNNYKCVLLMHGIRSSRTSMIDRALLLKDNGYSVLLIDLQAHGETPGEFISFGYLESESARKAVSFLRETKSCKKIASLGVSLGGAASLLGKKPLSVDAIVLEAVYSDIETAVENRVKIRLGFVAKFLAPLLYHQLPLKHGIELKSLSPIDSIKNVTSSLLIIAGTEDKHTTLSESKLLFTAAPEPKAFWEVEGAAHVDFYAFSPEEYATVLLAFLQSALNNEQVNGNKPTES